MRVLVGYYDEAGALMLLRVSALIFCKKLQPDSVFQGRPSRLSGRHVLSFEPEFVLRTRLVW